VGGGGGHCPPKTQSPPPFAPPEIVALNNIFFSDLCTLFYFLYENLGSMFVNFLKHKQILMIVVLLNVYFYWMWYMRAFSSGFQWKQLKANEWKEIYLEYRKFLHKKKNLLGHDVKIYSLTPGAFICLFI
jgi:hypothetical protein